MMEGETHETHPSLKELPEELLPAGRHLVKALQGQGEVAQAFSDFCGKAYVKPDWAGAASEFLATLFEDRQDLLAEMTRIPDLIIELASGHLTLTCMVAYRWAANSDTARLSKLAEALAATHSKMSAPEVIHIMLALVTSLAITRYPRAELMLSVAEPNVKDEHLESLQEARLWLAAGSIVRGCDQKSRDLWEHRLRRSRTSWTWDSPVELTALSELSAQLTSDRPGASLFTAILPPDWRERAARWDEENALTPANPEAKPYWTPPEEPTAQVADTMSATAEPPIVVWSTGPFFIGGLVGAAALALVIWLGPYDLKKATPAPSVIAPVPSESPSTEPSPTNEPPQEVWRREKAAGLALESPDLQPLYDQVSRGVWADHEKLLSGDSNELLKEDGRYAKLLIWLHVAPPTDIETRSRLPNLLAKARPDSDTLELWTRLCYEGSPMKTAIQEAAKRQLHENQDSWSASQELELRRMAWGS